MSHTQEDVLKLLFGDMAPYAHICSFAEAPESLTNTQRGYWSGGYAKDYPLSPGNQYICVSTFAPTEEGKSRRRKAQFAAQYFLMIDDIGEKTDPAKVALLPAATIELASSNHSNQWFYKFSIPCTDQDVLDNLTEGMIAAGLTSDGVDPGMRNTTRYGRLPGPGSVNSKAKRVAENNGVAPDVKVTAWRPDNAFTVEHLAALFGIDLYAPRKQSRVDGAVEIPNHPILKHIEVKSMLSPGRYDCVCPKWEEHTGGDKTGTAVFTNDDGTIGFKCMHGSHQESTAKDLIDWIDEETPGFKQQYDSWRRLNLVNALGDLAGVTSDMSASTPSAVSNMSNQLGETVYPHIKIQDNGKQRVLATRANLEELMRCVGIDIRYNVIQKRAMVTGISSLEGEEENTVVAELKSYCAIHGLPKTVVDEQLSAVMNSRAFNPVTKWLKNIERTGTCDPIKALVESLAITNKDWAYIAFRRWLIQTVAAADAANSTPNIKALPKFETVLTQYGAQGLNKTAFFRSILPQELSGYVTDGFMLDVTRSDSIMEGVSNWIVELGELDSTFRRSDLAAIKAYLSKQRDTVRKPYAKSASLMPRQTSYVASVNEEKFLRDTTGNRRYAPLIVTGKLEVPADFDATDFWAYVWGLYMSGEQWWFTQEEEKLQQEALKLHENLPLEDMLLDHFDLESKTAKSYMNGSEILKAIGASDNQSNRTILGLILKNYAVEKKGRKYSMQKNSSHLINSFSTNAVPPSSFL